MASGAGVLRDTVTIAADPAAPLAQKAAIFNASAIMAPAVRARLAGLLDVVAPSTVTAIEAPAVAAPIAQIAPPVAPNGPPTGPGSPSAAPDASKHGTAGRGGRSEAAIQLVAPPEWVQERRLHRRTTGAEVRVRRVLAAQLGISTRQLAKRACVSDSTASKWRGIVSTENAITSPAAQQRAHQQCLCT